MNAVRIDQLRGQPTEMEWLEFKRNRKRYLMNKIKGKGTANTDSRLPNLRKSLFLQHFYSLISFRHFGESIKGFSKGFTNLHLYYLTGT